MSAQNLDRNADGYVDAVAVPNADGTTRVFTDDDQNGVFEGAAVLSADGTVRAVLQDLDGNGVYDITFVDQNGNGVLDTVVVDSDGDGVFDTSYLDADENGILDVNENGILDVNENGVDPTPYYESAIVGPVTNPDPVYSLILMMSEQSGTVAYGTPDSDHDGWDDAHDFRPYDPESY